MKNEILVSIGSRKEIDPSNILMLKADTNYTIVYLVDGTVLMSATTLGIIEERLKGFNFYRTHRSTLINLNHIPDLINKNNSNNYEGIWVKNNIYIPVARRKWPDFLKTLEIVKVSYAKRI